MTHKQPCTKCKGAGCTLKSALGGTRGCFSCNGVGYFEPVDAKAIIAAIVSTRGQRKGKLLKSRPSYKKGPRAYFVWRLARFHGGADVCMPVSAYWDVDGDPFKNELELLADEVAKAAFGTDLAGAARWGSALGMLDRVPDGLPASAYHSGPAGTAIGDEQDSPEYWTEEYERAARERGAQPYRQA